MFKLKGELWLNKENNITTPKKLPQVPMNWSQNEDAPLENTGTTSSSRPFVHNQVKK